MSVNNFLPFATGTAANVMTQAQWLADTADVTNGFSSGILPSVKLNKALRQSTFISSAVAQFVSDILSADVLDNGNIGTFETQLKNAIITTVAPQVSGEAALRLSADSAEALARANADTAEAAARATGDSNEAVARVAADNALNTSIGNFIALFNFSAQQNGYFTIPAQGVKIYVQFAVVNVPRNATPTAFQLPTAFPHAPLGVVISYGALTPPSTGNIGAQVSDNTSIVATNTNTEGGANGCYIIAIGY